MLVTDEQLKQILFRVKLLDQKKLDEVTEYAKNSNISLAEALLEKDIVTDENLGMLVADALKIPFIVLGKITIPEETFRVIPERIARKHKMVPFARDQEGLKVAMSNVPNPILLEQIMRKIGQRIVPHLATERDIYSKLWIYRKDLQKVFDILIADKVIGKTVVPMAKIVDLIIGYAYQDRASDIHIEPEDKDTLVRFRIDGILHDVLYLPKKLHDQITTRIKVLSSLRTDEHLTPQDGKMRVPLEEEDLDIRVSILPVVYGEKIVMRLLASKFRQFSLVDLGMRDEDLQKVNNGFKKSYGMVLSTGPTGSGKSTSIYAILKIINSREKNITTIEDPVEYRLKGINQIQTNIRTELTFASGLRSILRQDPNVIMVGEVRDSETAGIAVNAALTGHLVLSTLHTNDASTALPRLIDMNVEPFLVASTVNVIVAQRLVRKICEMCKASQDISIDDLLKNLPAETVRKHFGTIKREARIYKGQGCAVCHYTGYAGRLGVFEVLEVTPTIRKLITQKSEATVIQQQAINEYGMTLMLDDGLLKVIKGVTTLEEILRVTKVETL